MSERSAESTRPKRMRRAERDALRSKETRSRLLEAALEVLVERGYGGFNTVAVCERAGAPRGTMLHHFPSRAALLVASLDHVFERRIAGYAEAFLSHRQKAAEAGVELRAPRVMLDLLWEEFSGPANAAWVELVVASRTDPELRRQLIEVVERFDTNARAAFKSLFPRDRDDPAMRASLLAFVFATLNGLALDKAYRGSIDAEPILDMLARLGEMVFAESSDQRSESSTAT